MSNATVVDDQNSSIFYSPKESWKHNATCMECNISHPAAQQRLVEIASKGTWTNAWWSDQVSSVTAQLEFQGTSVAVYFIMFFRSMDPRSTGLGSLYFFVDNRLELNQPIHASNFTFERDISPRTLLFQTSLESNEAMKDRHSLRIAWTHNGVRPRVAVALDSIEYSSSSSSSSSLSQAATSSASTPTSASASPPSNRTARIVGPVVAINAAILLGFVAFLLLRRRRRRTLAPHIMRRGVGSRYRYVPARPISPGRIAQVEAVEGRRISFSLPTPHPQTHAPNRLVHSRNHKHGEEGYIEPFTLHLASSSQQAPRPVTRYHQHAQPLRPSDSISARNAAVIGPSPIQAFVSPSETNWSSFYTSPTTVEVRGGASRPWAVGVNASDEGSSVTQSGTGAATYASSNEGNNGSKRLPACVPPDNHWVG